jgi:hypothetical protein
VELKYTQEINTAIDRYTDNYMQIKNKNLEVINSYLDNVFLTEEQKTRNIQTVRETLIKENRTNQEDG